MSQNPRNKRNQHRETPEETASRLAYIGTLASGLAHEIRSPLNAMKLNLDLLNEQLEKVSPDSRDEFKTRIGIIGRELDGLQKLLTDFLKFARPPQMMPLATDVNDLLTQVSDLVEPECRAKHIEIVKDFQKDLYPVSLDHHQFGRSVLLNLMTNAREQIGEHGTITLRTRETPDNVEIHIEDNGGGVSPDNEKHIFELFFSTKEHGTGLGLPIARRIVQEHGGDLILENHPGKGAHFIVKLPKSKILEYKKE
jgi:signal transduction histidine kinase